jgi:type I restriction enzyme S subunit
MTPRQIRTYDRTESIVFRKTKEAFGGLSNMAGGFPLVLCNVKIRTSEALYQACRFPHRPEIQRLIIQQQSPMTAKMRCKPYVSESRSDWNQIRVRVMRWCLRVKLVQNWQHFGDLLLSTAELPIVEESRRDAFWGARPVGSDKLVGMNVLGRLLMELREGVRFDSRSLLSVEPLTIPKFLLDSRPIPLISAQLAEPEAPASPPRPQSRTNVIQQSFFDQSPPTGYTSGFEDPQ